MGGLVAALYLSGAGGDAGEEVSWLLLPLVGACSPAHRLGGESGLQGLAYADPSVEGYSSVSARGVGTVGSLRLYYRSEKGKEEGASQLPG